MRDIDYKILCDILEGELSEDVQLSGTFQVFSTRGCKSIFFQYDGDATLETLGNNRYSLKYDNTSFKFSIRDRVSHSSSRTPEIHIPIDLTPEAMLNITNPKNIRF